MNETDTAGILRRDALSANDNSVSRRGSGHPEEPNEPSTCFTRSPFLNVRCSLVTVEPVVFLTMFSVTMQTPLNTEYLWDRISQDVGTNVSKASGCSNESSPLDPLQEVASNFFCTVTFTCFTSSLTSYQKL